MVGSLRRRRRQEDFFAAENDIADREASLGAECGIAHALDEFLPEATDSGGKGVA